MVEPLIIFSGIVSLIPLFFHVLLMIKDWKQSELPFKILSSIGFVLLLAVLVIWFQGLFSGDFGFGAALYVWIILLPSFIIVFLGWLIRWIVIKKTK